MSPTITYFFFFREYTERRLDVKIGSRFCFSSTLCEHDCFILGYGISTHRTYSMSRAVLYSIIDNPALRNGEGIKTVHTDLSFTSAAIVPTTLIRATCIRFVIFE